MASSFKLMLLPQNFATSFPYVGHNCIDNLIKKGDSTEPTNLLTKLIKFLLVKRQASMAIVVSAKHFRVCGQGLITSQCLQNALGGGNVGP